ncbi:hypothetical protein HHI36_009926 [Cryptolaemus montrouzieri]|uniref:Uncharacterized protein n=1 Tax=Cryptolaemus montrouzieri TaxID=559131 RepID=A0ABD2MH61_9CUCU
MRTHNVLSIRSDENDGIGHDPLSLYDIEIGKLNNNKSSESDGIKAELIRVDDIIFPTTLSCGADPVAGGGYLWRTKRLVRLMFGLGSLQSCSDSFIGHGLLTVPSIFIMKTALYAKNNLEQLEMLGDHHGYGTRNAIAISYPLHRSALYEASPKYVASNVVTIGYLRT